MTVRVLVPLECPYPRAATAVAVLCADVSPAVLDRFPGLTDRAAFVRTNGTKGPWEVKDPERLLEEFNRSKFPPDVGLRVRSCAALKSCQKVHGAEKMADEINLLSTGLLKIMARTLPPLQQVAIGKISDSCAGFWRVQFTVGEGKRYEKLMLEGLCLLERGFPSYKIQTTIFHYCVHIASHWRKFGPPRLCNCFVFERHIGAMVCTIQSRGLYVASLYGACVAISPCRFTFLCTARRTVSHTASRTARCTERCRAVHSTLWPYLLWQ